MKNKTTISLILSLAAAASLHAEPPAKLEVKPGDHISIIGNTLADRMQHDGYLESLIYKAFPKANLTFRDLGFSGDELTVRQRSESFGTPDEWLTKTKTDVVLAFFGFNESFAGPAGLEKFKADLAKFIDDTAKQYYNGNSPARLVLLSPIAQEKLADPNIADPAANNANIKLYASAMAEVAKQHNVQFIDLYAASEQLYKNEKAPLTFNGIHLTESGYKQLAPVIFKSLFGTDAPAIDSSMDKLIGAVREKNEMFFSRYRTVDGYNVYGGRSQLSFPTGGGKITNNKVMQEEMAVRDVMTANRDKRVWAVAQGSDLAVDDSNAPNVEKVETNKPDAKPFLSGQDAIKFMSTPKGVQVSLWASEEQFPELIKPVQMSWDTKGRLWVAAWRTYPERTPWDKEGDSILIFEDTKGTGHADKVTHFIDGLNCPTGFTFYKDGILLMQAPDLWYVKSTKGDDHADWKERVIDGMDSADSHHTTNAMVLDPGGATYLSDGVFHRTQVETAAGPVRNIDAAIYRFEPLTSRFERYISYGFANPHGKVFDYWGNDIVTDATGNANYFAPAFSGHIDFPAKHPGMQQFWNRPSRPCPGTGMISSRAWPAEFNGNFLNCNVIGVQGIFRVKVSADGSGLKGETLENLVTGDIVGNPNFRPSQVNTGPDGAVYFADWSNAIIGHMQHHIRDPNRDHVHGRIYKMTYEGKTVEPAKIDGQPVAALLDLLKQPENDTRTRAKIELGKHQAGEVIAAVDKWAAALDKNEPNYEHNMLEALWVHQWHNVVDLNLLEHELRSPDFNARAAATRVLCYWRDRVPNAIELLKVQANDESPRVRLEAVRALSFFNGNDAKGAIAVATDILAHPTDYYLDYTFKETMKQLQSIVKETVLPTEPKALAYVLEHMTDAELLKTPATEATLLALLARTSVDLNERIASLKKLGELRKSTAEAEFPSVLMSLDAMGPKGSNAAEDLSKMFGALLTTDLAKARPALLDVAQKATQTGVAHTAWAAVSIVDGNPATTWAAAKSDESREALAHSMGMISDATLREQFQPLLVAATNEKNSPSVRAAAIQALPLMGQSNYKANFALIAARLTQGDDRTAAARAIMQLPRPSWDASAAGPAAQSVLAWAKSVPSGQRTSQEYVETAQAGMELASLLPPSQGTKIRKDLRGLGVSVYVIKTVREQMRYDTTRLVVEAGKPFEVIMENIDFMPHNLVFVDPGTRLDVAKSVENMKPDKLDKQGRAYMPDPKKNKHFIDGTKLIESGQKATLKLTAPKKEGDYEYVCTFPGHAQLMFGTLVVTRDVDAYLAAHPVAPAQPVGDPAAHVHQH
jgi:azurin/glucose/arabinose dehydrogenase